MENGGWRRTLCQLRGRKHRVIQIEGVNWNPEIDRTHKVLWVGYGPWSHAWFQCQGEGSWCGNLGFITIGWQYQIKTIETA